MTGQNVFFNTNIKFLRERRRLSQERLATILSITRAKLAALEGGHTKSPQPEDYIRFSDYFKISIDSLLKVDLSKLSEFKLRNLEAGNDVYIKGGNLRVLAISVNEQNRENVEYVSLKAKAGYLSGYHDTEFIAGLPKYVLPNLPQQGTFRIFPIEGDSMIPIPSKSDIVAQFVEDWTGMKAHSLAIVILKEQQDIVFKAITIVEGEYLYLESLNPKYAPYRVMLEEVAEIWKFYSYQSRTLPEIDLDIKSVNKVLSDIKMDLALLKSNAGVG